MPNEHLNLILDYHQRTKHSYQSVRSGGNYLDWANRPLSFKIYSDLEPLPLPRDWPPSNVDASAAISSTERHESLAGTPDLKVLASILFHTAGITRHRSYPGGEIYFRAAACTGALYEIELYVVCGPLPDLEAGVYHFNPADFSLRRLRTGDWRQVLVRATADEPAISQAPITIVCTGTYWRNAWKYQSRAYRHFFWDDGTMLANLFATATAQRVPTKLVMGFVDDDVNRLLDLNIQREVAISVVSLGKESTVADSWEHVTTLNYQVAPYSRSEVDYPLMRQAHEASSLETPEEVEQWRSRSPVFEERAVTGALVELKPLLRANCPNESVEQVILRRGSSRQFARSAIPFNKLSTLLFGATQGISADFLTPLGTRINDLYVIINAVEGITSGAYYLRRDRAFLELLKEGSFRQEAGHLGLDQNLPADAAVSIFFLANLKGILETFGNRGYRAAQVEAGIIGGKIYLGAYAQGLGATGLTFYDDEVTEFFSPHAKGKSAIFLIAVGLPFKSQL